MTLTAKQKRNLLKYSKEGKPRLYTEEELKQLSEAYAQRVILSYVASSLITLRDKFGFSRKRMNRFLKGQSNHAQAIKTGYVTSEDIFKQIKLETKFDLNEFVIKEQFKKTNTEG